ncbi:NUDIX domain-containing protein [Paenibacillus radicis (ex Xue et al. 2023)]|uniref:NUDIX domain-containing protein n=1 Tax=Paenibacillus radicis (ex Xue et al. 2023) TaxID=2972489 RepID=A0ABT1YI95_9BACL|nr:NUDIX domain-containing protein [Paenibacillus radicis (ex Xue et al. 2023)]MCR8631978.1 NUDIX domain-containing protein [Paenibacillus radicis (ex Xue et al. 2023)]
MPMSEYYTQLRDKIGTQLIFSPSVAGVIRNQQGEILFQRPSLESAIWSLPAGAIEIGETPAKAVVREVFEETGLKIIPKKLLGVIGGGELEAVDGESAQLRFFGVDSMPQLAIPYPKEIFYSNDSDLTFFQV